MEVHTEKSYEKDINDKLEEWSREKNEDIVCDVLGTKGHKTMFIHTYNFVVDGQKYYHQFNVCEEAIKPINIMELLKREVYKDAVKQHNEMKKKEIKVETD